jgi:hypothetical protein
MIPFMHPFSISIISFSNKSRNIYNQSVLGSYHKTSIHQF